MSDKTGELIVKPCHSSEIDFYETTKLHPRFQEYLAEYIGTLAINADASQPASGASHRPLHGHSHSQSALLEPIGGAPVPAIVPETWIPSGGRKLDAERGVVLENVTYGFVQPNILDVKLGRRLWADDAPLAKRQRLERVADETTSSSMGFRIAGMKTWQGPNPAPQYDAQRGYLKHDKAYGRSFTSETVHQGFREYFRLDRSTAPNRTRKIIKRFISDLRGLIEVLEAEESRMYSASLLFVYEGDPAALAQSMQIEREILEEGPLLESRDSAPVKLSVTSEPSDNESSIGSGFETARGIPPEASEVTGGNSDSDSERRLPRIQTLKMIDFAHAKWTPGLGPDENVLHGIRGVVGVLEGLLN